MLNNIFSKLFQDFHHLLQPKEDNKTIFHKFILTKNCQTYKLFKIAKVIYNEKLSVTTLSNKGYIDGTTNLINSIKLTILRLI